MNHPFYNKDYTKRNKGNNEKEAVPQKPAALDQKLEKENYGLHANQSRRWEGVKKVEAAEEADEGGGAPGGRRQSTSIEEGVAQKKGVNAPYGKSGVGKGVKNAGHKSTNKLKGVNVKVTDDD